LIPFKRTLSSLDVFGYSLAMTAPTLAMSFVVGLVARVSGAAAPLAVTIGLVVMVLVGLSFSFFEKELASSGSVYEYVRTSIGPSWGFIAGWALLLASVTFAAGASAITSVFLSSFLSELGVRAFHLPISLNVGSLLLTGSLVWVPTTETNCQSLIDKLTIPRHVLTSALPHHTTLYDASSAARKCRGPVAYVHSIMPFVDPERFQTLTPQLVRYETLGSGHFSLIEIAD